jgi:hypothetical protein
MADSNQTAAVPQPEKTESPLWMIGLLAAMVLLIGFGVIFTGKPGHFSLWIELLGLITVLAIFSILYQENPIFRFMEHIYIGLAVGYGITQTWFSIIVPQWLTPMLPKTMMKGGEGYWGFFIALLLGLLFFTVYVPRLSWMNRFAICVTMGWAAGNALQAFMGGLAPQIVAAFRPPITAYAPADTTRDWNNVPLGHHIWVHPFTLIALVVLVCTLTYFFFSIDHKKSWIRKPANAGRYFIMITLGAIFGTTVMGRLSLAIDRLSFIITAGQHLFHLVFH